MFEIDRLQLHSPIFLGGKNLSNNLDPKKVSGLIIQYDEETKRTWVEFSGEAGFFGIEGFTIPKNPKDFGYKLSTAKKAGGPIVTHASAPQVANVSRTAQVESPTTRVQNPPTPPQRLKQ